VTSIADCEFCAIARGESTADVVCEGEHWVAFFPLEPATPGHTLVIPREHVRDLWAASGAVGRELIDAVIKVGRAIETALTPDGLNLITSAGAAAEQTVTHLHLHVVPRWKDDGFGPLWPPKTPLRREIAHDAAALIREACATPATDASAEDRRNDER
jgi:histidine triad (HIT) family protein